MEILQIAGFVLAALTVLSILKQYNPSYLVPASIASCAVLLFAILRALGPLLYFVESLSGYAQWTDIGCVLKAVVIALLTQGVQELCREAGQFALAGRVELAGKLCILLVAMPLFVALSDILLELLR
ncbi:MAG: stage III sporulation AC/AD family protein [Ruthenibacterium sp.]